MYEELYNGSNLLTPSLRMLRSSPKNKAENLSHELLNLPRNNASLRTTHVACFFVMQVLSAGGRNVGFFLKLGFMEVYECIVHALQC